MSIDDEPPLTPKFTESADPPLKDNRPKRRKPPFSLRFSDADRARLEHDAAGMSLAAYVRWRLFDPENPPPRQRGKAPVKDEKALSALLADFGKSRLSSNLNQLARAVNTGSLPVTPDVEAALLHASAEIVAMRALLIEALGLKDEPR